MFGFGISEIITLAIVIIILVNPKDLPGIVRKLGKTYASIMKQMNGVRKGFSKFEEEIRMAADLEEDFGPDALLPNRNKRNKFKK